MSIENLKFKAKISELDSLLNEIVDVITDENENEEISKPSGDKIAEEIKSLKEQKKTMEDRIDELKAQIIVFMKDKKRLVDHFNNKLFSYTRIESTNFDTKAFKKDYPKLYEEYTSKSSYMKFQ